MLKPKQVEMAAPPGDSCSRSRHCSDFSNFGDFEQELVEAITAVETDETGRLEKADE